MCLNFLFECIEIDAFLIKCVFKYHVATDGEQEKKYFVNSAYIWNRQNKILKSESYIRRILIACIILFLIIDEM